MCGIVGIVSSEPVNQQVYDASSSCSTAVRTRPASRPPRAAPSTCTRPRARCARRTAPATCAACSATWASATCATRPRATRRNEQEAQPFYVNAPYGIVLVHNGNLTNTRELTEELFHVDRRHLNTDSRHRAARQRARQRAAGAGRAAATSTPTRCSPPSRRVHERVEGSYAAIALIAGHGLLAFRDPFGIRPLVLGRRPPGSSATSGSSPSESLVLETRRLRDRARRRPRRGRLHHARTARCSRGSARRTRGSSRARSSTSTSPAPTRS